MELLIPTPKIDEEIRNSKLFAGIKCGKLTLKLASTQAELEEALKLRFEIFNTELGEGLPENVVHGRDIDLYDTYCDHLLTINAENKIVGCCRLLPGFRKPLQGYYTSTEFNLEAFPLIDAQTVELGRTCIHPDYRKQTTLMAFFWALHKYCQMRNARILLGCASLPKMSNHDANATFEELKKLGRVDSREPIKVLPALQYIGDATKGTPQIPPLVSLYIEFGARIMGKPAYDAAFECFDLPLLFDMQNLSQWGLELLERFDRRQST